MRIDMNVDQYEALTDLICYAYDNGYYHNRLDTDTVDQMAESRHMQMGALVSYMLQYPDMTIRVYVAMASQELEDQEEDLNS